MFLCFAPQNTHTQVIEMVSAAGVQWWGLILWAVVSPTVQVKYAHIRFCESIVFITTTQKWPETCRLWDQEITRKHGLTNYIWSLQQWTLEVRIHIRFKWGICIWDKIMPANVYLYCNLSRNWRWHYMGFTWVGSWNCPCKSIVLPHIGITWGVHWSSHGTAHVKPLFCHTLTLHGVYTDWTMKMPM